MNMLTTLGCVVAAVVLFLITIASAAIKIVQEYERGVIFRLGRLIGAKGPGLFFIIPFIDRMVKVDLRVVTLDVPAQECITRDNVTVKVNAVAYFRVVEPTSAIVQVEDYKRATWQIAQTTLRNVIGQSELDELLAHRERINTKLQQIIDEQTEPWGVKVSIVEIKDVELPATMQRAMPDRRRQSGRSGRKSSTPRASTRRPRPWPRPLRPLGSALPPSSSVISRRSPRSPPRRIPPSSSPYRWNSCAGWRVFWVLRRRGARKSNADATGEIEPERRGPSAGPSLRDDRHGPRGRHHGEPLSLPGDAGLAPASGPG